MRKGFTVQDALVVTLAGLVAWAFVQLSAQYGLPVGLTAAVGAGVAGLIVAAHLRARSGSAPDHGPWQAAAGERWALWAMGSILLAAFAVRLHALTALPAWDDEMWTLRNIYTADWGELVRVALDDYWPPLHYLILNVVARVFDTSLLWLRLPSVLFGVLAVGAMFALGRSLFGSRMAGVIGAALLAGMTTHVLYSQEARVYSLQVFLAIVSAATFFRSWRERRISAAFVLSTVLLTYAHSFASWYFVAAQWAFLVVAWAIWRDGAAFRKGLASQLVVGVFWLPLLAGFLYSRLAREIVVPTYWATGQVQLPSLFDIVEQYQGLAVRSWAGAALFALLFLLAVVTLLPRRSGSGTTPEPGTGAGGAADWTRHRQAVLFLLCWSVVPVLFSLVVSVATPMETFGEIRYHMTVLPGLCMLATAGLALVRSRSGLTAVAALVVLLPAAQLKRHFAEFGMDRPAVNQAADLLRAERQPGEPIYAGNGYRSLAYYYRGFFPRIGSDQWDSLTAAHAGQTDRYSHLSVKWGDTYAFEKLPEEIVNYGYFPDPAEKEGPPDYARFIAEEVGRGGFREPYWLIVRSDGHDGFLTKLREAGVECTNAVVHRVRGLELHHCGGRERPRSSSFTALGR